MKLRAEISEWSEPWMKNGVFITNDSGQKCYAFASHGSSEFKWFKAPITMDLKYRKFIDLFIFEVDEDRGVEVKGSKGAVYYVKNGKCTCPGYQYRGDCKHVRNAE